MKQKPLSLKFIALGYLLAPVGNLIQIAYFNQWPFFGPRSIFYHLTPYEWTILGMFPVVAFGIWRVSRWGYFMFLAFAAFLILNNTYTFFVNRAYSPYVVILFQLFIFAMVGFFVQKHIVAPYFNPGMRWWETNPRYKVDFQGQVRLDQTLVRCHLVDISSGGCFIEINKELGLNHLIWLHLALGDRYITTQARVVWVRKTPVQGYGVMFTSLERTEERKLEQFLKEVRMNLKKSVAPSKTSDSIPA